MMRQLLAGSVLAVGATTGVALAFLVVGPERLAEQVVPQVVEEVDARDAVITKLQAVGELTTVRQRTEQIVPVTRTRELWGQELGQATLTYVAVGEVEAGIDLGEVRRGAGPGIIILPPVQILDVKINVDESLIAGEGKTGLAPSISPEMQQLAQREALTILQESALCDTALQEMAQASAVEQVSAIMAIAGVSEEEIEVVPAEVEGCDDR